MNVVVKPGGLAIIGCVICVLLAVIVYRYKMSQHADTAAVSAQSSPVPASTTAPMAPQPYTYETPLATVQNGGFESPFVAVRPYDNKGVIRGEIGSHWYDDSSWAPVTVTYAPDTTNPHSGKYCQKITAKLPVGDNNPQFAETVKLVPDKKYTVGLWLRADHPMTAHVLLRQATQPCTPYATTEVKLGKTWKRVTATGPVGADPICYLMLQINESGTVWVDDASLVESK